ncbi:ATP-dependent zinc protease [Amylibacter sp. SFDW26]|uniref:ATP-dependent zinc protease family protein n=1 Tax=Amylibacter sp. SFDW26 TaxID=2652722 RepID=UPI0012615BEB|nr:RimK/LysX family protein [Amylibacter sp. SFDW26]KAB7615233.1 ATP-dependent zinc protease [Amylibacter sp. SFDW26]
MPSQPKSKKEPTVIGWMEYIDLPDIALHKMKAKIDTGARTSALHATDIEVFQKQGSSWVKFNTWMERDGVTIPLEAPVSDIRDIKNTGGVSEKRLIIETNLLFMGKTWPISISLADRSNMRFPMIIGRTALKQHNIAVHTRKTYMAGK